jgi:hypothetical protein
MHHWFDVTASSRAGERQAFVPFSRVLPSSFEDAVRGMYGSGLTAHCRIVAGMAHKGGWQNNAGT